MGLVSALMDDRRNAIAIGDFSEKAIDQRICVDELLGQTLRPDQGTKRRFFWDGLRPQAKRALNASERASSLI
jgi:hypothetical protein